MTSNTDRKILKDEYYLITSHDTARTKALNAADLGEAFRVAGVRKGVRVTPVNCYKHNDIGNIKVDRDVSFKLFDEVVQEVANKTGYLVFIDAGSASSIPPEAEAQERAKNARRDPILSALPGRN